MSIEEIVPPVGVVQAILAVRRGLSRLTRGVAPPTLQMLDYVFGMARTHMVYAAAKLSLADHLAEGPKTVEALAALVEADAPSLRRLLRALTADGVFEQRPDGSFAINAMGQSLRTGRLGSLRNLALYIGAPHHMHAWEAFTEVVKTGLNGYEQMHGEPVFDYLAKHPAEARIFSDAMADGTRVEARALAKDPVFGMLTRVCDVGGGRGILLGALLTEWPKLRGLAFDLPHVVEGAIEELEAAGVAGRCELAAGSFFDVIPSDCDGYVLKDILHDWDDARSLAILKAIRLVMRPGATLLILEDVTSEGKAQFPNHLFDLQMMVSTCGGKQRTALELAKLVEEAGLTYRRASRGPLLYSIVEAVA